MRSLLETAVPAGSSCSTTGTTVFSHIEACNDSLQHNMVKPQGCKACALDVYV